MGSPCKAQHIANDFLPNPSFAPAPIKRRVDGGEAMKGTWATEKGSQRTGVEMKVDAQGHKYSRIFFVAKDWRRRLRTKVTTSRFRGDVQGQGYYITLHTQLRATMETAFRAYGCGNTAPIRDKEPIRDFYKDHPIRKRATTGTHFRATRTQRPMHGAHANRKRGNSFLADRETSGEANH